MDFMKKTFLQWCVLLSIKNMVEVMIRFLTPPKLPPPTSTPHKKFSQGWYVFVGIRFFCDNQVAKQSIYWALARIFHTDWLTDHLTNQRTDRQKNPTRPVLTIRWLNERNSLSILDMRSKGRDPAFKMHPHISIRGSVCPLVRKSICRSVCQSLRWSINLSVCWSICPLVHPYLVFRCDEAPL